MTPVSIWRAAQISSPNLESFPSQLSKFGYHQTPDRLLSDTWHTSDWLLADSQQTSDGLTLNPIAEICWRWHQVSILESCPDQLSKFGELSKSAFQFWLPSDFWQTTDWLLTYSWLTPNRLQTDSQQKFVWDDIRSQFGYYQTPKTVLTDTQWTPDWHPTDSRV